MTDLTRKLVAEGIGTAGLVMTVVGSGIMAERLTDDVALQLLCNTLPTGAILVVLISTLGPVSGAHFNPAVTFAFWMRRDISGGVSSAYCIAQIAGGCLGTLIAHAMYELPLVQISTNIRSGTGQWIAETVAAFGLVAAIFCSLREPKTVPWAVGLYITAAYWFTASTSFANPAVTVARSLTDTFPGIAPAGVPVFILAQLLGAAAAGLLTTWLLQSREKETKKGRAPKNPPKV